MKLLLVIGAPLWIALIPCGALLQAAQIDQPQSTQNLPSAPAPQPAPAHATPAVVPSAQPAVSSPANPQSSPGTQTPLSLKQAEAIALRNNPLISVARLTALASQQVTRE